MISVILSRNPPTGIHHLGQHLPFLTDCLAISFSPSLSPPLSLSLSLSLCGPRRERSFWTRTTSGNIPPWPRRAWRSDSWRDCHASWGWGCRPRSPSYLRMCYWVRSWITFPRVSSAGLTLSVTVVTFPPTHHRQTSPFATVNSRPRAAHPQCLRLSILLFVNRHSLSLSLFLSFSATLPLDCLQIRTPTSRFYAMMGHRIPLVCFSPAAGDWERLGWIMNSI